MIIIYFSYIMPGTLIMVYQPHLVPEAVMSLSHWWTYSASALDFKHYTDTQLSLLSKWFVTTTKSTVVTLFHCRQTERATEVNLRVEGFFFFFLDECDLLFLKTVKIKHGIMKYVILELSHGLSTILPPFSAGDNKYNMYCSQ